MNKEMNGKIYDTEEANLVLSWHKELPPSYGQYSLYELYQKTDGDYFLLGRFLEEDDGYQYDKRFSIEPVTENDAKLWAEIYFGELECLRTFGSLADKPSEKIYRVPPYTM